MLRMVKKWPGISCRQLMKYHKVTINSIKNISFKLNKGIIRDEEIINIVRKQRHVWKEQNNIYQRMREFQINTNKAII